MRISTSRTANLLQVPDYPSDLDQVSEERPWVYLGKANSLKEKNRLLSDFQDQVAAFHETTQIFKLYVFKECVIQDERELSPVTFKQKLNSTIFYLKNYIDSLDKRSFRRAIVDIFCFFVFCFSIGAGYAIVKLLNQKALQHLNRPIPLRLATPIVSFGVWMILNNLKTASQLNKFLLKMQGDLLEGYYAKEFFPAYIFRYHERELKRGEGEEFWAPKDIFLKLEIYCPPRNILKEELLNLDQETGAIIDPIFGEPIQDSDLNSPRTIVLFKRAYHIDTVFGTFVCRVVNSKTFFYNMVDQRIIDPDERTKLQDHLRHFFCVPNIWGGFPPTDDSYTRKLLLKKEMPARFHRHLL